MKCSDVLDSHLTLCVLLLAASPASATTAVGVEGCVSVEQCASLDTRIGAQSLAGPGNGTTTLPEGSEIQALDGVPQPVFVVRPTPEEVVAMLVETVIDISIDTYTANEADAKLEAALAALDEMNRGDNAATIDSLFAVIRATEAQRGAKLTERQAQSIISAAQVAIDVLRGTR